MFLIQKLNRYLQFGLIALSQYVCFAPNLPPLRLDEIKKGTQTQQETARADQHKSKGHLPQLHTARADQVTQPMACPSSLNDEPKDRLNTIVQDFLADNAPNSLESLKNRLYKLLDHYNSLWRNPSNSKSEKRRLDQEAMKIRFYLSIADHKPDEMLNTIIFTQNLNYETKENMNAVLNKIEGKTIDFDALSKYQKAVFNYMKNNGNRPENLIPEDLFQSTCPLPKENDPKTKTLETLHQIRRQNR